MTIELSLFGAFRQFEPAARIEFDVPPGSTVGDVRAAISAYAQTHWSGFQPALLKASAFASDQRVLRDAEAVPEDGRMALLPPVSGG